MILTLVSLGRFVPFKSLTRRIVMEAHYGSLQFLAKKHRDGVKMSRHLSPSPLLIPSTSNAHQMPKATMSLVVVTSRNNASHVNSLLSINNWPICKLALVVSALEHIHCNGSGTHTSLASSICRVVIVSIMAPWTYIIHFTL